MMFTVALVIALAGVAGLTGKSADRIPPPRLVEPLSPRIDALIAAGYDDFAKQAAPRADDAEFVRRIYLDLTGTIPTAAETRAFLDDQSPAKRGAAHPQAARQPRLRPPDGLVLGRDADGAARATARCRGPPGKRSSAPPSRRTGRTTRSSATCSRPTARDPKTRAAGEVLPRPRPRPEPRDPRPGRVFLGRNIQCAQCHDHPLIDDYKQDALLRHPGVPEPLVSSSRTPRRRPRSSPRRPRATSTS